MGGGLAKNHEPLPGNPISELRSVTCGLPPNTCKHAPLQPHPGMGLGLDLPTLEERKAELAVGYTQIWFSSPYTDTYPSTNHLIATRPGVEPTASRSQVPRPNRYTPCKPPGESKYRRKTDCISVDNLTTVGGRKASGMSKVSEFCPHAEKAQNLYTCA